MAIQVGSNFDLKSKLSNFDRDSFDTLQSMAEYPETSIDEGHISYCVEDEKHYEFKSTNEDSELTGKWREFSTGSGGGGGLTTEQENQLDASYKHSTSTENPHKTKISNLDDVDLTDNADGKSLVYNEETGKFHVTTITAPSIGENGNWWVGDTDTGVKAQDSTGRVRFSSDSSLGYLSDLVDGTLSITEDGLLSVTKINGLKTTVAQLNFIQGLDKNIMTYLNAIGNSMEFKGVVETDDALNAIAEKTTGDTYIVQKSASNNDKTMTFVYNGKQFDAIAETSVDVRDFDTDPIDLESEVTGTLPMKQVENGHTHKNKAVLDLLSDSSGELLYNNKSIGSGSSGGDGDGGTSNYNELENKPQINSISLSGDKSFKDLGAYSELLSKDTYASKDNDGYVKQSEKAIALELFDSDNSAFMYYGTNSENKLGKHSFPINTAQEKSILQQRIFENVSENDTLSLESVADINNKAIINVWKELQGAENIDQVIKSFNKYTKNSINCSYRLNFEETSVGIAKDLKIQTTPNDNGFYDIDLTDFTTITQITGGVN